jgi:cytochrome c oxidase assembly protein subunit 15
MHGSLPVTLRQQAARPAVRAWLYCVALLVFAMVIVGGATRLTESGLSITEWQPVLGALPPLSEAEWLNEFEKYKAIPQYQIVNRGMSLDEFKLIYWWEWSHRLLGRLVGFAFLVPFLALWLTGRIERRLTGPLVGLFALGAAQGLMGWYMVMSGLAERVSVSQYRLAAHLTLAVLIFAALIWVALGIGNDRRRVTRRPEGVLALGLLGLVILQIAAGGFLAGLDAGMGYNTWPMIDGAIVPAGLWVMEPWWRNLFENALTVQFAHRMLAYAVLIAAGFNLALMWRHPSLRLSAAVLLTAVLFQAAIGIATLLAQVPIGLALAHQAGALAVVAAAVWHVQLAAVEPDHSCSPHAALGLDPRAHGWSGQARPRQEP